MMTNIPIYQVDAFTDVPFKGNPAAVCLLEREADPAWMQNIAAEMNLSETAFIVPKDGAFGLRWFTPGVEVDLCGHATVASAHTLWETGVLAPDQPAYFDTLSGRLTCSKKQDWIEMDFPAIQTTETTPPKDLMESLGVEATFVGRNRMDYLVEVEQEEAIHNITPDFNSLAKIKVRGIIVTAQSNQDNCDFISRFFAPAIGINEDPVTGSAHCCLAEYWGEKLNKDSFIAYQASKRGGWVKMNRKNDRVILSGQAVTIFKGNLI